MNSICEKVIKSARMVIELQPPENDKECCQISPRILWPGNISEVTFRHTGLPEKEFVLSREECFQDAYPGPCVMINIHASSFYATFNGLTRQQYYDEQSIPEIDKDRPKSMSRSFCLQCGEFLQGGEHFPKRCCGTCFGDTCAEEDIHKYYKSTKEWLVKFEGALAASTLQVVMLQKTIEEFEEKTNE